MRQDDPAFRDAFFRNKQKKGGYRIIEPPTPALEAPVADTHAHLEMLNDPPLALARSAVFGLGFICSIVDVYEDKHAIYDCADVWRKQASSVVSEIVANGSYEKDKPVQEYAIPRIRVAIGCHPHNAKHFAKDVEALLLKRLKDPRTAALGEVGLDYHYDFSPRNVQREVFRRQIALAHETGLPLILHLREAHDEALTIMEKEGFPEAGTVLHCFNLDWATLEPWVAHDCYVAFGGPLTFKRSEDTRAAALRVPKNRLLTETDAPYMTPEPMRGMECGPEHTIFTAEKLAAVFGCTPGEERKNFLSTVYQNALDILDREATDWQQTSVG